jgi:hypothetical protein
MDVGILMTVIMNQSVNDLLWFLACSRIVKIDQRFAIDLPVQYRKISTYVVD